MPEKTAIYEIRPTLQYAIRLVAKSPEDAVAKWRKRRAVDQGKLTSEGQLVLKLINNKSKDYDPPVEAVQVL